MPDKSRKEYIEEYHYLGSKMFSTCEIPTVYTFAKAYAHDIDFGIDTSNKKEVNKAKKERKAAQDEISEITSFTKNESDIQNSINRRQYNYSEEESSKFMKSVIAANVTDITESGYFYKKLMSCTDSVTIDIDDCGSEGMEFTLPLAIDEKDAISVFEYKIRNRWVVELGKYVEEFEDLPKTGTIHVRTFLTCKHGIKHFCKKCAGLFRRSYDTEFTPNNIGMYSTLMITEHATQASLDSMNNGTSEKINVILEKKVDPKEITFANIEEGKQWILKIIDTIGNVGVESRFYEVALLSRWNSSSKTFDSIERAFTYRDDKLGTFIYKPNKNSFKKLVHAGTFKANSMKTKIAFDEYD